MSDKCDKRDGEVFQIGESVRVHNAVGATIYATIEDVPRGNGGMYVVRVTTHSGDERVVGQALRRYGAELSKRF